MNILLFSAVLIFIAFIRELLTAYDIKRKRNAYICKHNLRNIPSVTLFYRLIKRLSDIILSLMVCILILPILYIILGLIIKLTSNGSIIFKQKRYGLFGKEFTCYKFRSMYQNASSAKVNCQKDGRITPIGRFIRKTHLDEFPQFFNVLKGDMSIVGPRPLPLNAIKEFGDAENGYYRLLSRPGITGLTQIKSGRKLPVEEYLQYDCLYVSTPSLINDLCIIIKTLKFSDISY